MLEYLRDNFFEVERDTFLVVNQFYQSINNEENIDNYCKFTNDLDFFLNNESRFGKIRLEKKLNQMN
jgi:hypothetical protein